MSDAVAATLTPTLTVSPDYGNAPFLWLATSPDTGAGCLCDGISYDDSFPMSQALWRQFADWAFEFDRTRFYSDAFDDSGWDWIAYHARGLQLARWLKEEVRSTYRVVYSKPIEDPNYYLETSCELLADGSLLRITDEGWDDDTLDFEFLFFMLQHRMRDIQALGSGATFVEVSKSALEDFDISFPLINEQRQISARLKAQLSEVDTARQAAQAQVRDAALLRNRLLRQNFDALHDVPRKVLGEWATTTSGSTPSRGDKRYWSPAEIPWVKTGEVAFAPITATEESISRQALAECSLTLLPPQSVLIAMYGQGKTRGQSAILRVEATTNQACFAILPNDTWDAEFLRYWLMASYEDLRSLSEGRGGNQANLNGALLNALGTPAPDIFEQRRLVTYLKAQLAEADAIARAAATQLAEIERLPQRLLAQAFAGASA